MFDLSGILKKYQETKKKTKPKHTQPSEDFYSSGSGPEQKMKISEVVGSESIRSAAEPKSHELYDACVAAVELFYKKCETRERTKSDEIIKLADRMVTVIQSGPGDLMGCMLMDYPDVSTYVFPHAVNTAIIALIIGRALGFERAQQVELVLAGLLHDVGLMRYQEAVNKRGPLTDSEYNQLKEHTTAGYDMLREADLTLSRKVLDAVYQEHERVDGSGYLRGLSQDAITDYARILMVADVYEALIHWRPYRAAFSAAEAVKILLDEKEQFDTRVLKALIEDIGIFPVGVFVQLNTKEIALVRKISSKAPFRPVVDIVYDATGKKLSESKQMDLSQSTVVYIEECVRTHHSVR